MVAVQRFVWMMLACEVHRKSEHTLNMNDISNLSPLPNRISSRKQVVLDDWPQFLLSDV